MKTSIKKDLKKGSATIGTVPYETSIKIRNHNIIADEPKALGGKNKGPTSTELLLGSLGACTAITLRMYANRKEWPLKGVNIDLSLHRETEGGVLTTYINRNITLEGDLTDEQMQRLLDIANKCPVHRTLTSKIDITTMLQ